MPFFETVKVNVLRTTVREFAGNDGENFAKAGGKSIATILPQIATPSEWLEFTAFSHVALSWHASC